MSDGRRPYDPRYEDEIRVRDLYLIFVRGLPAILLVAVLVGAGAFAVTTVRPASYQAEAAVTSGPPSVRLREDPTVLLGSDGDGVANLLTLEAPRALSFEAYRAVARSRDVFARARDALGDRAPELEALRGAAEVVNAHAGGAPLLVYHRVVWTDPDTAATFANAWAEATIARVREKLVDDLEPTLQITQSEMSQRREALEAAEAALAARSFDADSAPASRERTRVELEVEAARRAYATVAGLEPTLTYLAELVPSGTRMLEPADPPSEPSSPSAALVTSLAAILGAMMATLGVFLREAVRDPQARSKTQAPSTSRTGASPGA